LKLNISNTNNNKNRTLEIHILLKIFLLFWSLIIVVISLINILAPVEYHEGWAVQVALVSVSWLFFYFIITYFFYGSIYQFASIYIITLVFFHLGITIPDAFGTLPNVSWSTGQLAPWLERAGWYTTLSLGLMGTGYSLFMKRKKIPSGPFSIEKNDKYLSVAFIYGVGLLTAAFIFFGFAIFSYGNLLEYSRVDFFRGKTDTRGLGVFLMVFPSAIILLFIGARKTIEKIIAYPLVFFGVIILIISGYRTFVFFPMMVAAVLWVKTGRKIPNIIAIAAILFVLVAIPIIGNLRSAGNYASIDKKLIEESSKGTSLMQSFGTMGQTAGVLAQVFRLVPEYDSYQYGHSYFLALRNSIPNIGFTPSKSQRIEAIKNLHIDPNSIEKTIPSDWITYRLARDKYLRGEGLGFSAIGEPYLNFGIFGVFLYFLILGMLLGKFDSTNMNNSANALIFAGALYWPFVQTVRNDFVNFVKPLVFITLILFAWRLARGIFMVFYRKRDHDLSP